MSTELFNIGPDTPATEAAALMEKRAVHQLLVVDGNERLIGIVTDRDVRSATGFDPHSKADLRVEDIMTTDPQCISVDAPLEEALAAMCNQRFNALPVRTGDKLLGIITKNDVLKAFYDLLGLDRPGRRIEVALPNGLEDVIRVVQALNNEDHVTSLIAARMRTDGDEPVLYLRAAGNQLGEVERKLRARGVILLAPEQHSAEARFKEV